ncbi:MAG: hypothetical protein V3V99_12940 [candidate division Zixibacteria bacterium]
MTPAVQLRIAIILVCSLIILVGSISAQGANEETQTAEENAINIFVDGPYGGSDYFRENITMANFVRDRKQADIHILITRQSTGSGGREYTIEFMGQKDFSGMRDTLVFYSKESDTEDIIREDLVKKINAGLVRYVARTPQIEHLSVSYSAPIKKEKVKDKWNYWVFRLGGSIWANGQKSSSSISTSGNFSARRVTENLRLQFSGSGHFNRDRYEYNDFYDVVIGQDISPEGDTTVILEERDSLVVTIDKSNSKYTSAIVFWGLNDHWSIGIAVEANSSTYSNLRFGTEIFPGLEFNYFPYSESTRRQLRFTYYLGAKYQDYQEETLYDKHNEWLYKEHLEISLEMIEPWGEADINVSGSHHFHDFSKYRLNLHGDLEMRIFEGLSFNMYGSISRIHDQLSLKKGGGTREDVLLRRTELATNYNYSISFGINYSFGSIYNNIVNPRFGY